MSATRGASYSLDGVKFIEDIPAGDRVSFRVISTYVPAVDQLVLRIDVKRAGEQFNCVMGVGFAQPKPDTPLRDPNAPLILPSKGVEQCAGGLVDRATLKRALLDLAEVL